MDSQSLNWRQLNVAVVGGGIGGLAAATSLRRAGHKVTIYERADYVGEAGASISCGANGSRWLQEWATDLNIGKPTIIKQLIRHDLQTGEVEDIYDLSDYATQWQYPYYNFYRMDLHAMLKDSATGSGAGKPAMLKTNHECNLVDYDTGEIVFRNGVTAKHELIIGADGVGSAVRRNLDIFPQRKAANSTSYHCVLNTAEVRRLGLTDMSTKSALEYWGEGTNKIVFSACRGGDIHSFYTFFAKLDCDNAEEGWDSTGTREQLLAPFPQLDPKLRELFGHVVDIKPWRLYIHNPYPHWQKGCTGILGDAAHPMLPDQSQGACQAIEDAAALGIIFGPAYSFTNEINAGLKLYEQVRKARASRVQAASARARENLSERIGFSSRNQSKLYRVADENKKLTIEEINLYDMHKHIAVETAPKYRSPEWSQKCGFVEHPSQGTLCRL